MKKIALKLMVCLSFYAQASAQNIQGIVLDENENAVEFATVAVFSDTIIISGAITGSDGSFSLNLTPNVNQVQFSMIGYNTETLTVADLSANKTVHLHSNNVMLDGVVVTARLPKTEVKGDAVVTNITGSVLEHSGNANDVIAKIPGMIATKDGLEVIGRGAPVYYINGRKVTDESELRNLMSEEIKSIDVVSNPGAQYGGNVRCVVRIRTIKHQGDGFSFALTSQAKQHLYSCNDFEPSWSVLDLNYRKNGWDFFGKVVYWNQRNYQYSDINDGTLTLCNGVQTSHIEKGTIDYVSHTAGFQYIGGANWQINENHSLGFKINMDKNNMGKYDTRFNTDVIIDGYIDDHLDSYSHAANPYNGQWLGNIYYDGDIGKLNVNFNADFVDGRVGTETDTKESSWKTPVELSSSTKARTDLGAGKLVLSYPVGNGKIEAGTEETYVVASQTYNITKSEIPSADASLSDNTMAGFAQYSSALAFGQISAGLRFEHADMDYDDHLTDSNSVERHQNDWFPSFSFASALGPVKYSLTYTGKTVRPAYNMLSNEIMYDNRYAYQCGDPTLENERRRTLSLNANWQWLTLSSNYEVVKKCIVQWGSPYGVDGIVMISYTNLDKPVKHLSFFINASPSVGFWYPNYTIGLQKQFLKMTVDAPVATEGKRRVSLDKPLYFIKLNNAFRFGRSWIVEANYEYKSPLCQDIYNICEPLQNVEVSVQKSFLKGDAFTIRLAGSDLLNTNIQHIKVDYGSFTIDQKNDFRGPCITLRLSYRFNSANNKYKGTGAGQDAKSRM